MAPRGPDSDQQLFGPSGRIPVVDAVSLKRASGLDALREGWRPRHTVAMLVLTPVAFLGYRAVLQPGGDDPVWLVLIAGLALLAALILTTYLPLRGAQRSDASACTLVAGLLVPAAALVLNDAGYLSGLLALGLLGLGLGQRLSGASACG